ISRLLTGLSEYDSLLRDEQWEVGMRGSDAASGALFSYVDMEARVPATHPLRTIRTIVNEVLDALDTEFEVLYEGTGRQSVAPERLLRASLFAGVLLCPFRAAADGADQL